MYLLCPLRRCQAPLTEAKNLDIVGWHSSDYICIYDLLESTVKLNLPDWKGEPLKLLGTLRLSSPVTESIKSKDWLSIIPDVAWKIKFIRESTTPVFYKLNGNTEPIVFSPEVLDANRLFASRSKKDLAIEIVSPIVSNLRGTAHFYHKFSPFVLITGNKAPLSLPNLLADLFLGIWVGLLMFKHQELIRYKFLLVSRYFSRDLIPTWIKWLMGWPAGLKLNSHLSKFLGDLFLWLLEIWSGLTQEAAPVVSVGIQITAISGVFGLSSLLTVFELFIKIAFFYVTGFYFLAAKLYSSEIRCLVSLWNLFRGKKWNMLHNRLDSADYTLDQLLLGTVFFAVLTCLLPTIWVYYLLFVAAQLTMVATQTAIALAVFAIRNLPVKTVACSLFLRNEGPRSVWLRTVSEPNARTVATQTTLSDGSVVEEIDRSSQPTHLILEENSTSCVPVISKYFLDMLSLVVKSFGPAAWVSFVKGRPVPS